MTFDNGQNSAGRAVRPVEFTKENKMQMTKVWDITVRLFHWSLVGIFVVAWFTADEWDRAHEIAGYAIGVLVIFRLIWGFIGTKHARFKDFTYSPVQIFAYLRDIVAQKAKRYIGHNPAGGAMVLMLLATLVVISVSGYAMTTNAFWGVDWVEDVHEASAYLILVFIAIHVAGVIHASISHRENLVRSMFTGKKRSD